MPYFVYKISPSNEMTHLDTKDKYSEAKQFITKLRADLDKSSGDTIRMIFAKNNPEAERLLMPAEKTDSRIIGDD